MANENAQLNDALRVLIQKLATDDAFRDELLKNPAEVLRGMGFTINAANIPPVAVLPPKEMFGQLLQFLNFPGFGTTPSLFSSSTSFTPAIYGGGQPYTPAIYGGGGQPYTPAIYGGGQPYTPAIYGGGQPYTPAIYGGGQPYTPAIYGGGQPYTPSTYGAAQGPPGATGAPVQIVINYSPQSPADKPAESVPAKDTKDDKSS